MLCVHRFAWRLVCAATVVSVLSVPASAQARRRPFGGYGAFQVGTLNLNMGELNSALTTAGFPTFNDRFFSIGGMGFGNRGRWIIGGEGAALIGNEPGTPAYSLRALGGYGLFRVGYDLLASETADLSPTMGFGGGGFTLDIRDRSSPTFAEVLNNPAHSSRLSTNNFMMGVGVDATFRILLKEKEDGSRGGLLFGASAGYLFAPYASAWKLNETNSVAAGPDVRLEGLYLRMSFGGWGKPPHSQ